MITKLGVDETSTRKGHHYVTLGVDMDAGRVIHVTPGKGKEALDSLQKHLANKGVDPHQIAQASLDLSPAFISGVKESFPRRDYLRPLPCGQTAQRSDGQGTQGRAQGARGAQGPQYTSLKNPANLSETEQQELAEMIRLYPTLGEAYRLKTLFNDLWAMPDQPAAEAFLEQWCAEVEATKIPAFMNFTKTFRAHWSGIVHSVESRLNYGIFGGHQSQGPASKVAPGVTATSDNFINMIYFLCGSSHTATHGISH